MGVSGGPDSLALLLACLVLSRRADETGRLDPVAAHVGARYRLCDNAAQQAACTWAVSARDDSPFCLACRLNHTIPDLEIEGAKQAWCRLESAKRRLIYSLRELGLPIASRHHDERGLSFVFAADGLGDRIVTGHDQGVITINIKEADDPFRERIRIELGEPYRTLLGHFRHEIGHLGASGPAERMAAALPLRLRR